MYAWTSNFIRPFFSVLYALAVLSLAGGCASRPINEPIAQVNPNGGYRPYLRIQNRQNNDPYTLFVLSFSGGGTRAAAFSYGVLEELHRTEVTIDGQRRRLIDEVDLITGVSGGSFTALSYALYGDQLFSEFEGRFLKRNVQGALTRRVLNPFNWWKFIGGSAGRSELAAEYYDEILFEGATFADLLDRPGPVAIATGTDLSTGSRLAFYQNDFDLICSDLNKIRLSRAAATSSAVPILLSPVTFNNYGGTCEYQYPIWVSNIADPENMSRSLGRPFNRYREMQNFQNSKDRPFIHLVDGGVADNLGVRGVMEALEELGASGEYREKYGIDMIQLFVLIVVNARSSTRTDWDRRESPPGSIDQLLQASGVPIDRYSFETVQTIADRAELWQRGHDLRVAQARLAGATAADAEAGVTSISFHVADISFDAINDPEKGAYFMNLPTSFVLPPEDIDRLRDVAGRLLRQSMEYRTVVRKLGGMPGE
ncbi:MAG: patatin-like phospholipase family protein [Desulfobacterales bacterium]|jgi:NTE family protein